MENIILHFPYNIPIYPYIWINPTISIVISQIDDIEGNSKSETNVCGGWQDLTHFTKVG